MADKIKLTVAAALLIAAFGGVHYLADQWLIWRIAIVALGMLLAAAVAWTSAPGKAFYVYAQESVAETRKVVWPTRRETIQTTGVVVGFVIAMALFLWIVDAALVWVVRLVMGNVD